MSENAGLHSSPGPLPERSIYVVEYPGLVLTEEKAVRNLGGLEEISKRLRNESEQCLELKFRPDDPHAFPVRGDLTPGTDLLLRVTKRKRSVALPAGGNQEMSKEATHPGYDIVNPVILGAVTRQAAFTGACDFQLSKEQPDTKRPRLGEDKDVIQSLLPLAFTHFDYVRDYRFKDNMLMSAKLWAEREEYAKARPEDFKDDEFLQSLARSTPAGKKVHSENIKSAAREFADYDKAGAPVKPPEGSEYGKPELQSSAIVQALKAKFETRPIFSIRVLEAQMRSFTPAQINQHLPAVAYRFLAGPWRSLWIRYGYDPREKVAARLYQYVEVRMPASQRVVLNLLFPQTSSAPPVPGKKRSSSALAEREAENAALFDYTFKVPSAKLNQQYQVCDLWGKSLQDFVRSLPVRGVCDKRTGWFFKANLREIRKRLKDRIKKYIDQGLEAKLDDVEAVPVTEEKDIEKLAVVVYDESPEAKKKHDKAEAGSSSEEDDPESKHAADDDVDDEISARIRQHGGLNEEDARRMEMTIHNLRQLFGSQAQRSPQDHEQEEFEVYESEQDDEEEA